MQKNRYSQKQLLIIFKLLTILILNITDDQKLNIKNISDS